MSDDDDDVLDWEQSCRTGDISLIQACIRQDEERDWNDGLYYVALAGSITAVRLMIERGATNWNWGLLGAANGGHKDIVHLMISKGCTEWDGGLHGAVVGGHMEIVQLMINKGASDWDRGLVLAVAVGNMDIALLMIGLGATNWNAAIEHAFKNVFIGHQIPVVLMLIEKGADQWDHKFVRWLAQRPSQVVRLFRRGRVLRALFGRHDARFEQWIVQFEHRQMGWRALFHHHTTLPTDLYNLVLSYL